MLRLSNVLVGSSKVHSAHRDVKVQSGSSKRTLGQCSGAQHELKSAVWERQPAVWLFKSACGTPKNSWGALWEFESVLWNVKRHFGLSKNAVWELWELWELQSAVQELKCALWECKNGFTDAFVECFCGVRAASLSLSWGDVAATFCKEEKECGQCSERQTTLSGGSKMS